MKRTAINRLRLFARRGVICAVIIALLCPTVAFGAGSRNLTSDLQPDGTWVGNGGYRPYTEWYATKTAQVDRRQKLHVYVKQGEIIYFGSSVTTSVVAGGEIAVTRPDGTVSAAWDLDVVSGGKGQINTREKEVNGPLFVYDGVTYNEGGYSPLSIVADMDGVWNFEFRSTRYNVDNPAPALVDAEWNQKGGTVAAWDITVISLATGTPVEKTGRLFSNFLALNIGANSSANHVLNSTVYVLTKDGYVYSTDFNGMDPYGFIFFANNRGLVNLNYNQSLYHSVRDPSTDIAEANNVAKLDTIGVGFQLPTSPDTGLDWTYKIFFEEPSDDLPASIKPTPYAPESVTDFYFYGDGTNHGYVGAGGYFYFTVSRASSFQVEIDMTEYEYEDGGETVNGGVVYLANACVEGQNRVYWDGKDARGVMLPAGVYGESGNNKIKVRVLVKSGEYHFPVIDAEQNKNGIKITLLSEPLDKFNNPIELTDYERSLVYYDNSTVTQTNLSGTAPNGFAANQLAGMDSSFGASAYTGNASGLANSGGDKCAVDLWTYFGGDITETSTSLDTFRLDEDDGTEGSLSGFVFYDTDKNGKYSLTEVDYALDGVTVELRDGANNIIATTKTDLMGFYNFDSLPYGNYTVQVANPFAQAQCTTGSNQLQSVTVDKLLNSADDVGFHCETIDKLISVTKNWPVDRSVDTDRPLSVIAQVQGSNGATVEVTKTAVLSASNGWSYVFRDLPLYASDGVTELTYSVSELGTDALGNPITGYTSVVEAPLDTGTEQHYTITNIPTTGSIELTKTDEGGNPIEGARFSLYRRGEASPIGSYTTNAQGKIGVSDLPYGNTYYFVETYAPDGFVITGSGQTQDIVPTNTEESCIVHVNVINYRKQCTLTVTKTVSEPPQTDESFYFRIDAPDNVKYYIRLTVPAGEASASRTFSGLVSGEYRITELSSNRSYTVDAAATEALTNSVQTDNYDDNVLLLTLVDADSGPYEFRFRNVPATQEKWLSASDLVVNKMR